MSQLGYHPNGKPVVYGKQADGKPIPPHRYEHNKDRGGCVHCGFGQGAGWHNIHTIKEHEAKKDD